MIVKSKNSIEAKIRKEAEGRKIARRQEYVLKGLSRAKTAQRGDFDTKQFDKKMADYRKFKNPNDREKIKREYFQAQRESRRT